MRFQLVFRTETGDRVELRDSSPDFEAHLLGQALVDGCVFEQWGQRWLARREDADDLVRFVCTPAHDR